MPAKSTAAITEKVSEPEAHSGLVACWQTYTDATKKDALVATIGVKTAYVAGEYEDDPARFVLKLDPAAGLAGPEAAADACVRVILEPALKAVVTEAFTTKLVLTVK